MKLIIGADRFWDFGFVFCRFKFWIFCGFLTECPGEKVQSNGSCRLHNGSCTGALNLWPFCLAALGLPYGELFFTFTEANINIFIFYNSFSSFIFLLNLADNDAKIDSNLACCRFSGIWSIWSHLFVSVFGWRLSVAAMGRPSKALKAC